jgi:hypothetical protein
MHSQQKEKFCTDTADNEPKDASKIIIIIIIIMYLCLIKSYMGVWEVWK